MPANYRLTIATADGLQEFTPSSNIVQSITVGLRKEKQRISNMAATLHDKGWELFNALPDPAFANVPIQLFLARASSDSIPPVLVFDGKITQIEAGYPGPSTLTITAHDRSIDARRNKRARTFRNATSVQKAQLIAKDYGLEVDFSATGVSLSKTSTDFGPELSDWDHVVRALAADGLYVYTQGSRMMIRRVEGTAYETVIQRGSPPVHSLQVTIAHVTDGSNADVRGSVAFQNKGTIAAISGTPTEVTEGRLAQSEKRTHKRPVRGQGSSDAVAHSEDRAFEGSAAEIKRKRRNKDAATLTCSSLPDLGLHHSLTLEGWGAKVDGSWDIESIDHSIIGDGVAMTVARLVRGPQEGVATRSAAQSVPFATAETGT